MDFQIRPEGGLTLTPVGEAHSPDHARPAELTHHDSVVPELVVASIADLEMMEELGSGASGCSMRPSEPILPDTSNTRTAKQSHRHHTSLPPIWMTGRHVCDGSTVYKAKHVSTGTLVAVKVRPQSLVPRASNLNEDLMRPPMQTLQHRLLDPNRLKFSSTNPDPPLSSQSRPAQPRSAQPKPGKHKNAHAREHAHECIHKAQRTTDRLRHSTWQCVTILEKTKRDQVVSELRIMKSHALGARWLVAMHNAFYEEAKVYTVLEMMDGGSLEDLVKRHAAAGELTRRVSVSLSLSPKIRFAMKCVSASSCANVLTVFLAAGGLRNEYDLAHIAREVCSVRRCFPPPRGPPYIVLCQHGFPHVQVLGGLNYLHRQLHQVHRDLKPANVMLNSAGAVKISDFGISSQLENTGAFAETFVGTTCYMSPERLAGERYSYGADVWALGLILLELATGKYPYPMPDSYFQLLAHIMDRPAPALPAGTFSADFAGFTSLCVDKVPKMRPSAHDLLKHPWLSLQQTGILDMSLEGLSLN